jgi:hypothetical protein
MASESMVPPAVALAIIEEKVAPERPRANSMDPTGPARGAKTEARALMVTASAPVLPSTDAATRITSVVMMPGAMIPGMVSARVMSR